jgi:hypothetical protein
MVFLTRMVWIVSQDILFLSKVSPKFGEESGFQDTKLVNLGF